MVKLLLLIIGCLGLCLTGRSAFCGESDAPPKSERLALLLALDPIPGDALLYAGRPTQAAVNFMIGSAGGMAFYGGALSLLRDGNEGNRRAAKWALGIGSLIYFPSLIWDAVVGIKTVRHYNKSIELGTREAITMRPKLAYAARNVYCCFELKF